jgi:hypothetical protein
MLPAGSTDSGRADSKTENGARECSAAEKSELDDEGTASGAFAAAST